MGIKIKKIIKKIQLKRTTVLLLVFILMAFVLVRQLFDLQIIQGENYINEFQTRTTKTRVLKSTRGNIYDCNGKLLAYNQLAYSVVVTDAYANTSNRNEDLNKELAKRGFQISNGYGDLKEKTFRIAHMADITVDEVKELLDNINDILGLQ